MQVKLERRQTVILDIEKENLNRWKDTACVLAIHVDRGFSLTEKATQKELWSQPYANLCRQDCTFCF